jgi:hypothetical protein
LAGQRALEFIVRSVSCVQSADDHNSPFVTLVSRQSVRLAPPLTSLLPSSDRLVLCLQSVHRNTCTYLQIHSEPVPTETNPKRTHLKEHARHESEADRPCRYRWLPESILTLRNRLLRLAGHSIKLSRNLIRRCT